MLNTKIAPWPFYDNDERVAVQEVMMSGRVNQWTGHHVKEFEKEFAEYVGTEYAVAVSNGTVALDLILGSFQSDPHRDEILVTSRTFMASVSSIVLAGFVPVFVDVDPETGNICPKDIARKISNRTVAIMCVHLAGLPCDMDPIIDIGAEYGVLIIEDCAQAHGAEYKGRKVGSLGHVAAWSFCQDKIMSTAGEGGMVTTNIPELYKHIWEFKDHGKSLDKISTPNPSKGFRFIHDSFGSNYRMTEIQAAVGRLQLKKLDYWIQIRNLNADYLDETLSQYSAVTVVRHTTADVLHAKYKHYAYVNPEGLREGWDRQRIIDELTKLGVPVYTGSCSEVYLEDAFLKVGLAPQVSLPNALKLGETSLMFLVHPTITQNDLDFMREGLETVLGSASKTVAH